MFRVRLRLHPLLSSLVFTAILVSGTAQADPVEHPGAQLRLGVKADVDGRDLLSAEGFDIAGYRLEDDWVEVVTDPAGARRLRELGFSYDLLESRPQPEPLYPAEGPDVPLPDQRYTNPAELEVFLQQTHADHPDITRMVDLGTSHEGLTLWGMLVSDNAAVDEDELSILFSGAHHAREVMTPEVVMDLIDHLTDGYGVDPDLTAKVDAYQIWAVPIVNPDGVDIVHSSDDFWRKNARDNDDNGAINSNDGVDLNRNYEWGWGYQCRGSSSSFSSATYRGPTEGSEPETRAMVALGNRIRPVFDVEYHSYGEDVFYAMSCDPQFNPKLSTVTGPDQDISRVIAEGFASRIVQADGGVGYSSAPYGSRVDGTGRDHQYHENGAIAFVTEINSSTEGGFHPDYGVYRDVTVEGQRPGWLWLIDRMVGPAVGGHVTDAITGLPLEADVVLDELTLPDGKRLTSRGDTGRFHVIVVEGDYNLTVSAPGYVAQVVPVTVGAAFAPLAIELQPEGSTRIVADAMEDPGTPSAWSVGAPGDTATSGLWEWGVPHGTHAGDVVSGNLEFGNPRFDRTPGTASHAWVTGNTQSSSLTADDVDGGATSLESPSYDLSAWYAVHASWQRWFRNEIVDTGDVMVAEVSADGGSTWIPMETLVLPTGAPDAAPVWLGTTVRLDDLVAPGPDVRFRFRVNDDGIENAVEAGVDDLEVWGFERAVEGRVQGVRLDGAPDTVLSWQPVAGAGDAVYDVVRGDLAALAGGPGGVSLGSLSCVENDSTDTSTAGDADSAVPGPGEGYFYLVRFQLGFSVGDWGAGSGGGTREGSGGCSP